MRRSNTCPLTRTNGPLRIMLLTALVLLVWLAAVTPVSAARMYIASYGNSKIVRAELTGAGGTDLTNPGGLLSGPEGLALDLAGGKMYIAGSNNDKIVRANLDGSNPQDLGNPGGFSMLQRHRAGPRQRPNVYHQLT